MRDAVAQMADLGFVYLAKKSAWCNVTNKSVAKREKLLSACAEVLPDMSAKAALVEMAAEVVRIEEEAKNEPKAPHWFEAHSPFSFAVEWYRETGIVVHENGQWEGGDLSELTYEVHRYNNEVFKLNAEDRKASGAERLRPVDVRESLEGAISMAHLKKMKRVKRRLRFDPDKHRAYRRALKRLVRILAHEDDPNADLHRYVIAHMIWQVKRKLMDLPVEDHMLLFLYGRQGGGKTTLLRKLGEILGRLYVEPNVEDVTAKFSSDYTERHYMANLEEFSGHERTQVEALKKFISQVDKSERDMFSMKSKHRKQNLTLFASSNRRLKRVVSDYSGMRRFWEIDVDWCKTLDFDAVNTLDYEALWVGCDETNPISPIRRNPQILARIQEVQEKWRKKSMTELWLNDIGMLPLRKGKVKRYRPRDLYTKFSHWCEDNEKNLHPSRVKFIAQLEDLRGVQYDFETRKPWIELSPPIDDDDDDDQEESEAVKTDAWEGAECAE